MQIPARLRPRPWLWLSFFLLAAAIALIGAALFASDVALSTTEELVRERLALYGSYLESEIDNLELLSALTCGNPDIIALLQHPANTRLRARVNAGLARANETANTGLIYVMDGQGKIIAASDGSQRQPVIGQTRLDERYRLIAQGAVDSTFVAFGKSLGDLGYYASCAVEQRDRRLGTVFVRAQVEDLVRAWRALPHGRLRLLVADRNGVVFLTSEPRWRLRTLAPLSPDQQAELKRTQQYHHQLLPPLSWQALRQTRAGSSIGTIPTPDAPDTRYVIQSETMRDTGWTVIVASDLIAVRRWVIAALAVATGTITLLALLVIYFHQRRLYLTRLFETSIRDSLTGLFTRGYMTDAVAALESLQDRGEDVRVALVMFDLDYFKRVNDTYGHRCGDAVLRDIGRIILEESRDSDIPVRYGGEELAIFLSVHSLDEAMHFAERVSQRTRERHRYEKWSLRVTVSAGVALRQPFESLPHLIERADRCLYAAKDAGRDRVIASETGVASSGA